MKEVREEHTMSARTRFSRVPQAFASTSTERLAFATMVLAAVTTAMMVQATRVFLSYMVFIIDQSQRVELGVTAGSVYLAIALGALVPRLSGIGRAIVAITIGLVAARLILQFWSLPEARMWLGAASVVLAGWLLPLLLTLSRSAAAYGIGLGLGLDLAFRIGRDSLDLPLSPGFGAHTLSIVLGLVAIGSAFMIVRTEHGTPGGGSALSALAFGPALALHHLTFGNLGALHIRIDAGMVSAAWLVTAGVVLGLALAIWVLSPQPEAAIPGSGAAASILALVVLGGVGLTVYWQDLAGLGGAGIVLGTAGTIALIVAALRGGSGSAGPSAIALWLTLGLLIHAILLFAYFTATGWPILIVVLFALVALVALAGTRAARERTDVAPMPVAGLGVVALALVASTTVLAFTASPPTAGDPLGDEFVVMTYNIQSGFSVNNYWDLEETARAIETAGPGVVLLQEVGRGWPILSAVDQAEWLSHRLDMQLIWGPASQDDLWGNAILTTAPVISSDWTKFETTQNLRRGAVLAVLASTSGPVVVVSTHLDNPRGASTARLEQVTHLIEFWAGEEPAVIGGDFNADPGSETMLTLIDAGFADSGDMLGVDATTSDDDRRIDYVLFTPGLEVVAVEIPDTWASDHRPVVTTLSVLP